MEVGKFNVLFGKNIALRPEILKYDSIKELFDYVNDKDANIEKVKTLVSKANRELRMTGKKLYVRKANYKDKQAENRICMTKR